MQRLNRNIYFCFILLIVVILFFQFTNIDEMVQNLFFNFKSNRWILDRNLEPYRFIFYDGIKKLLIFIGIIFLISYFIPKFKNYKNSILIIILSSIIIPLSIGFLKKETNIPCPKNRIIYGGIYPKTKLWQHYPSNFYHHKIKCWPAGHASGGFTLMSLFILFRKKRYKYLMLGIGIFVGWSLGLYKMLIGDHFLSHTIITMLIAWLEILIIIKIVFTLNFYIKKRNGIIS